MRVNKLERLQIMVESKETERTPMQVGWQDEGNALQPVHHGYCLWLSGLRDVDKLVRKVPVQVKIVAVVPSSVTPHITWEEIGVNEE